MTDQKSFLPVVRMIGGPMHNELSPVEAPTLETISVRVDNGQVHVYNKRHFVVGPLTFTGFAFHALTDEAAFTIIMKHFCHVTAIESEPAPEKPSD